MTARLNLPAAESMSPDVIGGSALDEAASTFRCLRAVVPNKLPLHTEASLSGSVKD